MRMVPTGRTIAQEWDGADDTRHREMLAEFDVVVVLRPRDHDPRVAITGIEISPDGSELAADKPARQRNRPAPDRMGAGRFATYGAPLRGNRLLSS